MNVLGTVGLIGRFKPLHNGGKAMLEALCEISDHVKIGIGSINKYDYRTPFTAEETARMIQLTLHNYSNYELLFIPDSGHIPEYSDGKRWVEDIKKNFGELDVFITGNDYVKRLLSGIYVIEHPAKFIPQEKHEYMSGTIVRTKMAMYQDYSDCVPKEVYSYLEKNRLSDRFRKEFGMETLAHLSDIHEHMTEDVERRYVTGKNDKK